MEVQNFTNLVETLGWLNSAAGMAALGMALGVIARNIKNPKWLALSGQLRMLIMLVVYALVPFVAFLILSYVPESTLADVQAFYAVFAQAAVVYLSGQFAWEMGKK